MNLLLVVLLCAAPAKEPKEEKKPPKAEPSVVQKVDKGVRGAAQRLREEAKKNKLIQNATRGLR